MRSSPGSPPGSCSAGRQRVLPYSLEEALDAPSSGHTHSHPLGPVKCEEHYNVNHSIKLVRARLLRHLFVVSAS